MQLVQPCEDTQQRRLPGAVRTGEQHNFARLDIEVDAGQGREPTQEAHGGSQANNEGHASLHGLHPGQLLQGTLSVRSGL